MTTAAEPARIRPGWTDAGVAGSRPRAPEVAAWVGLLAFLVVSRVWVAPDVLYDWDAANYALSTRAFDPFEHQPHPPGAPVWVALLRLLGPVPGDAGPFLAADALLGGATVVLMGAMVRRSGGPLVAWLTAAAFCACPLFWYQGAVASAYIAECFASVLVAAASLGLSRRRVAPWLAGLAWAVAVGLRPNGALTLLPLAGLGLALSRAGRREIVIAIGAFAGGCAVWFVPLIAASGGWSRYAEASGALASWQLQVGSALGGRLDWLADNARNLAMYVFDATNLLWLLLIGAVLASVRRPGWRTVAFLAVWTLPGAALYAVHHLPKSGYVLTLVPVVFVATAVAWSAVPRGRVATVIATVVVGLYVAVNAAAFVVAVPRELLVRADADLPLPAGLVVTGDYGVAGLAYRTWPQRQVSAILDGLEPDRDVAVFLFGAHELHRLAMWSHPDHWLVATSLDHHRAYGTVAQPPWNDTFGTFQIAMLQAPVLKPDWRTPTGVDLRGERLTLVRGARILALALPSRPDRVVVFAGCPPCALDSGPSLSAPRELAVGGGYKGWELSRTADPAE